MNLIRASAKGDLSAVKELCNEGVDVNLADASGRTALIEAAWGGHADIVNFLVEKGANINSADMSGYTAIMRASEQGYSAIVTSLINNGADVNCRGKVRGTTPLMLAAEQGHLKIIDLLLANGAQINAADQYEETALARAYHSNQTKAAKLLESKGGRSKPERSFFTYNERETKPQKKASIPAWSAAAYESETEEDESQEPDFEEE